MIDFFNNPDELAAKFKAKNPQIHFDYDEIMHEAHARAFTVAKMTNLDLLKDMQNFLAEAMHKGMAYDEWKKDIIPHLKNKGWWGEVKVKDPKTGEEKDIYVGARRLKKIFDTNLRSTYQSARKQSLDESSLEYYRYSAVLDSHTRASHKAMHGIILPKEHEFWKTNFPPNGWNCRCTVRGYSKEQIKNRGLVPYTGELTNISDKDWAYDKANPSAKLDSIFNQKASEILKAIKENKDDIQKAIAKFDHDRDLFIWQKGLDKAVDELLIKKNLASPINAFGLGKLSNDIIKKAEEILKLKIQTDMIMGDKKGILHIKPERKSEYGQDLRIDEIKQIVKVLDNQKTSVSIDTSKKNIIFWFGDEKDKNKINKIAVDLNYTLKKFGLTNYMVTVGKALKSDEISKSEYIKIR